MGTLKKALWRYGPTTRPSPQRSYVSQFNHGYNEVNNTFDRLSVVDIEEGIAKGMKRCRAPT